MSRIGVTFREPQTLGQLQELKKQLELVSHTAILCTIQVPDRGERFQAAEIEVQAIARSKVIDALIILERAEKLSFYFPEEKEE